MTKQPEGALAEYRAPSEEREALNDGRLLILTAFPPEVRRTTRTTALECNCLLLTLASEVCVPHIAKDSPLATLLVKHHAKKSPADSASTNFNTRVVEVIKNKYEQVRGVILIDESQFVAQWQ